MRSSADAGESGRVLVVDDDETVRALFVQALELTGIDAIAAADGEAALSILETDHINAVLLDSQMPGMDGTAVLRAIRANSRTRTLPVIFVTGHGELADRVRGLETGANDYLVKPVELSELIARVRAQLRGQAAWLRVVESHLRERSTVTEALCRLRPERTPEMTADRICEELARLRNLDGVVLVAANPDGVVIPLARHGRVARAVRIGLPLPSVVGKRLMERAARGAWTEHGRDQPPGATGPPLLGTESLVSAYAPLRSQGRLLGLLALSTGVAASDAPSDETAQALSAAIDFAGVASALLGPALNDRIDAGGAQAGLRSQLKRGAFMPVFQPIVDLAQRATVGYEALTRFTDGTQPQRRFADATRLGMGLELERATMAAAVEAASSVIRDAWISINVSPAFLTSGEAEPIASQAACDVVLELTEHDPVTDYELLSRAVARIPSARLSIDDAGAGYACLTHVLSLRPAFVKLDRGWITKIDADPARQALVAGLRSFTDRTGSTLIAEGVETAAELETLRFLQVDLAQGFLLGRPMPARELARAG